MAESKDLKVTKAKATDDRFYVAPTDQIETLPDGREKLVARKGQRFTRAQAVELGLVKQSAPAGPAETKVIDPSETKGAKGDAK